MGTMERGEGIILQAPKGAYSIYPEGEDARVEKMMKTVTAAITQWEYTASDLWPALSYLICMIHMLVVFLCPSYQGALRFVDN